jgi:hypothetical protein
LPSSNRLVFLTPFGNSSQKTLAWDEPRCDGRTISSGFA